MKYLTTLTLGLAMLGFGLTSGCTVHHEESDKPSLLGGENHESKTTVTDPAGNTVYHSDDKTHSD
jgi:hypothetical protein